MINLKLWINDLSERLRDTIPEHFLPPQVNQKHMDNDDNSSAGHASYMFSCAPGYGSFDKNDAENTHYFTPANESNSRSYAAVIQMKTATPMVNEVQFQERFQA
jgi:hypothetical protein